MLIKDLVILLAGVITGAINSVGGGGMLVGYPVLLLFGMPALAANATANVITLAGQVTSSIGYRHYLKRLPKAYLLLMIPCALGAAVGAFVLRKTTNTDFELVAPILVFVAVLLFAYQPHIHSRLYRNIMSQSHHGPSALIVLFIIPLAIYGGYFGAGFGLVMLAILSLSKLTNIHEMNSLKNITAASVAIASIIVLFNSHLINWHYGLVMSVGTAAGGYIGARSAQRLSMKFIRGLVLLMGVATAIYLTAVAFS